jgi:uncharacterized protein
MIIICPVCGNKTTWEENPWKPFCSERCKFIDLGKWVIGDYKIEDKEETAEDEKQT